VSTKGIWFGLHFQNERRDSVTVILEGVYVIFQSRVWWNRKCHPKFTIVDTELLEVGDVLNNEGSTIIYSCLVCVYCSTYESSSSLDTPSLSLGDQSRGDGGVSLNEEELNAPFRVSTV
jgi:hypothetical protein